MSMRRSNCLIARFEQVTNEAGHGRGRAGGHGRGRGRDHGRGVGGRIPEIRPPLPELEQDQNTNPPEPEHPPPPPEPLFPTIAQILANQNQFMEAMGNLLAIHNQQQQGSNGHNHSPPEESLTRKIDSFIKLRPPTFDFSEDLLEADVWLREVEKKLDLTTCTDEECVALATCWC